MVIYPPATPSQARLAWRAGPPIEAVSRQSSDVSQKRDYFLSVGRLTYAKRVDLAIEACKKLGVSLKIVGTGKEEECLRELASQGSSLQTSKIEFLGGVSDDELAQLYTGARALIFSALDEDFGMVPVEAMAHGTPVIGLAQGGVKETVADGVTGVLFQDPTQELLEKAMKRFMSIKRVANSMPRARENFQKRGLKELRAYVNDVYKKRHIEANV